MDIVKVSEVMVDKYVFEIFDFVYFIGFVFYDYYFGIWVLFDRVVFVFFCMFNMFFGWDVIYFVMEGEEVLGFFVFYYVFEFWEWINVLGFVW